MTSRLPLELQALMFPMGFPVEIETNSPQILEAARQAWGRYPRLSGGSPVRIQVSVGSSEGIAAPLPLEFPVVSFDAQWVTIRHCADNYANGDLAAGLGEVHLTEDRAADLDYVNYYFLKPLTYLLLAPPHFAFVHAACVALHGRAAILCGDAAAGKTCLAFACARQGWTFVSGDATHLLHKATDFSIAGRPFSIRFRESARDLFPELRAWPSRIRPNLKAAIEVDTDKLNILTAMRARASCLVFLQRQSSGAARVETVPREEARLLQEQAVFFGDNEVRRNQRNTLERFLALPCLRLIYSDLVGAEAALRGILPDGA